MALFTFPWRRIFLEIIFLERISRRLASWNVNRPRLIPWHSVFRIVANLFLLSPSSSSQHFSLKMHSTLHSTSAREIYFIPCATPQEFIFFTSHRWCRWKRFAARLFFNLLTLKKSPLLDIILGPLTIPTSSGFAHLKLLQIAIGCFMNYSRGFKFKKYYISIFLLELEGWIILITRQMFQSTRWVDLSLHPIAEHIDFPIARYFCF